MKPTMPKFEPNPDKARINLRKHRVSFEEAQTIWQGSILFEVDEDHSMTKYVIQPLVSLPILVKWYVSPTRKARTGFGSFLLDLRASEK